MRVFIISSSYTNLVSLEAVVQWCSVKQVFLEVSQDSQENTCARVSFLIKFFFSFFPVNFVKFLRNLFTQNTSGGCFCRSYNQAFKSGGGGGGGGGGGNLLQI